VEASWREWERVIESEREWEIFVREWEIAEESGRYWVRVGECRRELERVVESRRDWVRVR